MWFNYSLIEFTLHENISFCFHLETEILVMESIRCNYVMESNTTFNGHNFTIRSHLTGSFINLPDKPHLVSSIAWKPGNLQCQFKFS